MRKNPHHLITTKDIIPFTDAPFATGRGDGTTVLHAVHTHPGIEIGAALTHGFMHLNGREFPLTRGDVYFVDAMLPHWHYGTPEKPYHNCWACVPFSAVMSLLPGKADTRLLLPFIGLRKGLSPVITGAKDIYDDIVEIHRLFLERPNDWDLSGWMLVANALWRIYRRNAGISACAKVSGVNFLALLPAIGSLDRNFRNAVSVADLAELCNLSPSRFAHLFAQTMSVSPVQYRNRLRISNAMELLDTTTLGLSVIAERCGFRHLSQFRDAFVKCTGTTPAHYRAGASSA